MAFGKDGWICRQHDILTFLSYLLSASIWETVANDLLVALTAPGENNSLQVAIYVLTLVRGRLGGTVVCELPQGSSGWLPKAPDELQH